MIDVEKRITHFLRTVNEDALSDFIDRLKRCLELVDHIYIDKYEYLCKAIEYGRIIKHREVLEAWQSILSELIDEYDNVRKEFFSIKQFSSNNLITSLELACDLMKEGGMKDGQRSFLWVYYYDCWREILESNNKILIIADTQAWLATLSLIADKLETDYFNLSALTNDLLVDLKF